MVRSQTLAFNDYNDDKAIIDAGGVPILLAALAPEAHGENKRTRVDLQVRYLALPACCFEYSAWSSIACHQVCAAGTLLNLQLCKESSHIVLKEGGTCAYYSIMEYAQGSHLCVLLIG